MSIYSCVNIGVTMEDNGITTAKFMFREDFVFYSGNKIRIYYKGFHIDYRLTNRFYRWPMHDSDELGFFPTRLPSYWFSSERKRSTL